ncbi:MAG: hypothetical protein K9N09_06640 [Candidatus Cloacimonetes bacterium]|nr:hypothetical protein [Candidatus Cloacimonadota bacterium]MCF7813768.1 hypothetical protein [Candidatus Cloacimonadota bacterium]MCF7868360.1 hypothetical protein [Candidatus Cloacimonadota bacterium]MCF7883834.1 hypothetical protein [Candidatus Cloacimonadota bacterium]
MKFEFIESGGVVSPQKNKLYLDVGNDLCLGIIDHHHNFEKTCAASLALQHKDYITAWITDVQNTTIVLHVWPDFDCVASAYIAEKIMRKEDSAISSKLQLLADYALKVDQALEMEAINLNDPSLYTIFEVAKEMILNDHTKNFEAKNLAIVQTGYEIFDHLMSKLSGFDKKIPANLFADTNQFDEQKNTLKEEINKYLSDRENKEKFREIEIELPLVKTRELTKVAGVIYKDPSCSLFKLLLRKGIDSQEMNLPKYVFSLIIFSASEFHRNTNYILSVDPDLPAEEQVDLLGLGDALNRNEEQKFREAKQNPLTQKGPRFTEYPLSDPWYDGRAHQWTIVASPRNGTKLNLSEIEQIMHDFPFAFSYYANSASKCDLIFKINLTEQPQIRKKFAEWQEVIPEKTILSQSFHNFLACSDKKMLSIYQNQNCRVFIHNDKIALLFVELSFPAAKYSLSDLFIENNKFNDNLELQSVLDKNTCSFLSEIKAELIYKNWLFSLKSANDMNTDSDRKLFHQIVKNFAAGSSTPYKTNFSQLNVDETVSISRYSFCHIQPTGITFAVRDNDPDLEFSIRRQYKELWSNILQYVVFNGLMLSTSLNFIKESVTEINYHNQKPGKTVKKLNRLKDFLIKLKTRSVLFNLTSNSLVNEIWDKFFQKLKIKDISENVDNSITELNDYLQTKRQSIVDLTVFILSLVIIPFSLLGDYFGGMLMDTFGSWAKFTYIVLIAYGGAIVISYVLYRIIHSVKKIK